MYAYQSWWIENGPMLAALLGAWVMVDASKRGLGGFSVFLCGLFTFLLAIVSLPLWLFFRPALPGESQRRPRGTRKRLRPQMSDIDPAICPACGGPLTPQDSICPTCGIHFGSPVAAP